MFALFLYALVPVNFIHIIRNFFTDDGGITQPQSSETILKKMCR